MRCMHPLVVSSTGRREFVPCGKCNFCLQAKRDDWSFRLRQELKACYYADFLTFTYDNEDAPVRNGILQLEKRHVQLFTKKLRQEQKAVCVYPIRYYLVGEYGSETLRPHYHSITFNLHPQVRSRLESIWSHGHVHYGDVTDASIHYVTKYVIDRHGEYAGREPPFALMSRRPGLGHLYPDKMRNWHTQELRPYAVQQGFKQRLPRYYADKIFDADQKAVMRDQVNEREEFLIEIERLKKLHDDPYVHYNERKRVSHDAIVRKNPLKQNQF